MKKLLPLLFLVFGHLSAQSLESLRVQTKKLYDANYTMDFPPLAELTYPKAVDMLGGKDKFIQKLDSDYQNEEFRMRLELVSPKFSYSEIRKIEGKTFCMVTFKNPIRYFYEKPYSDAEGKQKAALLRSSTMAYEVVVEPKRNSINVKRNSKYVAVIDDTTAGEWKFFNLDDVQQRDAFYSLFPETKKQFGL